MVYRLLFRFISSVFIFAFGFENAIFDQFLEDVAESR